MNSLYSEDYKEGVYSLASSPYFPLRMFCSLHQNCIRCTPGFYEELKERYKNGINSKYY